MRPMTHTDVPSTLNGYPVKAFTISAKADRALVIVLRPYDQMWIAASYWPELGDEWQWGNYYTSYEQADAYRREWMKTHCSIAVQDAVATINRGSWIDGRGPK